MRQFVSGFVSLAMAVTAVVSVSDPVAAEGAGAIAGEDRLTASAVATGAAHSCVIVTNGRIACWGSDSNGQLGNGPAETGDVTFPAAAVALPPATYATALAAGDAHTCALLNTKGVTCWGSDADGQLGNGDASSADVAAPPTPIVLPSNAGAIAISAGASHTCAVLTTNQVTCWGSDASGQLGNGAGGSLAFPTGRVQLAPGVSARAVTAGAAHTCALLSTGAVSCWGGDSAGQLGNGAPTANVESPAGAAALPGGQMATAVTAGAAHTCAVLADGGVSCWGENSTGQLGTGSTTPLSEPSGPIALPDGAVAVAAGTSTTCSVSTLGDLRCWGSDSSGQLGNGAASTSDALSPSAAIALPFGVPASAVEVGDAHVCAVQVGGALSCWGDDAAGQLGNGNAGGLDEPAGPVDLGIALPGGASAAAVAEGANHTCVLLSTGEVSCWGSDSDGQLGNGAVSGSITSPPLPLIFPGGATATAIAAGARHTCALLDSGEVSCWGYNSSGQLGTGTTDSLDAPSAPIALPVGTSATAISAGNFFTCAILDTDEVTCWGNDFGGQLGNGAVAGDVLAPPAPIALPGSGDAVQIATGVAHTCALLSSAEISCWGLGGFGQVGDGTETNRPSPTAPLSMPAGLVPAAVTTGSFHSCAIFTNNRVSCWGFNINGQLGNGTTNNRSAPPSPILFPGNANVVSLASGDRHNCAVLAQTNEISCWGLSSSGQLGNGVTAGNVVSPTTPIPLPDGLGAQAVSAGGATSCAILATGQVSCWGSDGQGQVGNGDPLANEPLPVLAGNREIVDPQAIDQLPRSMPLTLPVTALTGVSKGTETVVDPISTATGNLTDSWTDLSENVFGMNLVRSYNGLSDLTSPLGDRWGIATGPQLIDGAGVVELLLPDGSRFSYAEDGSAGYTAPTQIAGELVADAATPVGGGILPMLRVEYANGSVDRFDTVGRLIEQRDWDGQNAVSAYNGDGAIETITASTGAAFTFAYTGSQLDSVTSSSGRTVAYGYDANDRLGSITDEFGGTTTVTYTVEGWLKTLTDPSGVVVEVNTYDDQGRVIAQVQPSGNTITLDYVGDGTTIVTDTSNGETTTYLHNEIGRVTAIIDPNGETVQRLYDDNGNLVENLSRLQRYSTTEYDDDYNLLRQTEPNGNFTVYTYDAANRVESVISPTGALTTFTYDGDERLPATTTDPFGITTWSIVDGLVLSMTDADGVTVNYGYDTQRRRTTTADALGNTTTNTYDGRGRLVASETPTGRTTTYVYGGDGRLASTTAPDGATTSFTYDDAGRLLSTTDPAGAVTTKQYNGAGELVAVVEPDGTTTYEYDVNGRRIASVRPGAARTESTFDSLGRVDTTTSVLADTTGYDYNAEGQLTSTTVGSTGAITATAYDSFGRISTTTDEANRTGQHTYDQFGRLVTVTGPDGASASVVYDVVGRAIELTDPLGGVSQTTYTPAGRVETNTASDGIATTNIYDAAGRRVQSTTSSGLTTTFTLNGEGETTSVTTPSGLVTSYNYDPAGRVATVTDPAGVTTTRTYTPRGRLATQQVGDEGTVAYSYNPDGTLNSVTDALGNTTTMVFDGRGNMLSRTDALGNTETWEYNAANQVTTHIDALGRIATLTYDAAGQLVEVLDAAGRLAELTYNPDGSTASATLTHDGDTIATSYTYNSAGRLSSVTEDGETVAFLYNPGGDIVERTSPASGTTSYSYDAAGRRTQLTYPDGTRLNYFYDPAGRLAKLEVDDNVTTTVVSSYTYDADGRVVTENLIDGTRTRSYDNGQLVSTAQDIPGAERSTTFAYDSTGRISSETVRTAVPDQGDDGTLCAGVEATIVGTAGDDVLTGTNGDDVIVGLAGNDIIEGGNGFDLICAGSGDDAIDGGNGNDTIHAGPGDDILDGGNGADALSGEDGADTITGGNGADAILGGNGNDIIDGGKADDVIDGGNGTDDVTGDKGNDSCDDAESTSGCETITNNGENDNAVSTTYTYDNASQLIGATSSVGSPATWTYDALGRRATEQFDVTTTLHTYDAAGQLCWTATTLTSADCSAAPAGATTFEWDASGRLLSESRGPTDTVTYAYDAAGRIADTTRVADTLTTSQARRWEADGMLAAVDTQVGADPTTTSSFAWDTIAPGVPQLATIASGVDVSNLVHGPGGWAGIQTPSLGIAAIAADGHGSTIPSTGNALARDQKYSPFGEASGTGTFAPRLGYRGELTLDNQLHLRARSYQADIGRFTTKDPAPGAVGTPTIVDPYHYTNNDPVNRIDPTGLFTDATYTPTQADIVGSDNAPSLLSAIATRVAAANAADVLAGADVADDFAKWEKEFRRVAPRLLTAVSSCLLACGIIFLVAIVAVLAIVSAVVIADATVKIAEADLAYTQQQVQNLVDNGDILPGYFGGRYYEPNLGTIGADLARAESSASSKILGDNLEKAGVTRPPESAAHHIIASGATLAQPARDRLKEFGIDINSSANGVFLPRNVNAANPTGAAVHSKIHTEAYYLAVNSAIEQATSREGILAALDLIRQDLLSGGYP